MSDLTNLGLDPNVPENTGGFTIVPAGRYKAVIINDKITTTKDGSGRMLELRVQIIEPPFAGDVITDRLNIVNKSPQAQAIGQGILKRICGICGNVYPPSDTTGIYGKPLEITVRVEEFESNKTGEMLKSNKISNYAPIVLPLPAAANPTPEKSW